METLSSNKMFGGWHKRFRHTSSCCNSDMVFAVYLPPQAENGKVPVLYWLSGLTCTDENFSTKAGAQQFAAEHGIMLVMPDTSPRNTGIEGEDDSYDFGSGAGFYVNATQAPWSNHYHMYDYVVEELPTLIAAEFPADMQRQSIFGHSMGGHGALTIALRNPGKYQSVSAFSPICAPSQVPWGQNALGGYLGEDQSAWQQHDATALILNGAEKMDLFIDQGEDDEFLQQHLRPDLLAAACEEKGFTLNLRYQPGYDHSYFFIASFVGEHIAYHAKALNG